MKIVHIQTAFTGMGNAPYRLHRALLNKGYNSLLINFKSYVQNDKIIELGEKKGITSFLNGLFNRIFFKGKKTNTYFYSVSPICKYGITSIPDVESADIIFLHWTNSTFLSLGDLKMVSSLGKPVLFFFHDKWYMTGGCHHNFDCKSINNGCILCPMFKWWNIYPFLQFYYKKKLFNNRKNLYFLQFSQWMKDCFVESGIYNGHNIFVIPPYIDEGIFYPMDKTIARRQLKLNTDKKIITFGSVSALTNKYKGWQYLNEALKIISTQKDVLLLIFGNDDENIKIDFPVETRYLGNINDENDMRLINSSADVFVSPSLVESYGMAIMENLLCGTPVVAFNTSSVPELIKHKENGYLAAYKDSIDLARGISFVLDHINKYNFVKPDYNSSTILHKYINMIDEIAKK